jgi:hypothetical protein
VHSNLARSFWREIVSLSGKLHDAEKQGKEAALQVLARTRFSLEEAQSRIRQKMRIRPRSSKPPLFASLHQKEESAPPQPIVTVNGRDLPFEEAETAEEHLA